MDSVLVEPDDWVATFNCKKWNKDSTSCAILGRCVGSRKWNTSLCGSGVCDLPAMGDGADGKAETVDYPILGACVSFPRVHEDQASKVRYTVNPVYLREDYD